VTPRRAAAAGVALAAAWLAGAAADLDAKLALARALEARGLGGAAIERALDAAVLLPLLAIAFAAARLAWRAGGRRAAALAAGAGALLAGLFLWQRELVLYRFLPVEPGALYRSGQMSTAVLEAVVARHDIRTLVFLRDAGESFERELELARRRGLRFEHVPMSDAPAAVERFLALMDDPESRPVLVHCHYGVARTGLLAAVYRMEYDGWDNARALREARRLAGFDGFDAESSKRHFLLSYTPRRASAATAADR
jgi:predicted protein tyrosine phosphatase